MGAVRFPRQRLTLILYRNFPTASLGLQTYTSFSPVNTLTRVITAADSYRRGLSALLYCEIDAFVRFH